MANSPAGHLPPATRLRQGVAGTPATLSRGNSGGLAPPLGTTLLGNLYSPIDVTQAQALLFRAC